MNYFAKVSRNEVQAVHVKTGGFKVFNCSIYKGIISASVAGDYIAVQTKDGQTRLWNPQTGSIRQVG